MKKTIGVLAHVDAGKTTVSEAILYHTQAIRKRGRVDHKDTFLDSHSIERERGITVFQDQGIFKFNGSTYYLIDTPGHVDFSTEMERAIGIMDYAVIIISAVEGVQGHTKTVWNLLRKYKVPTIIFVNKIDRENADTDRVIKEIRKELNENAVYVHIKNGLCEVDSGNIHENNIEFDDKLVEYISEYDDELLEKYFEGNYDEDLWRKKFKELVKENKIFPCFKGSALQDKGVVEFLYGLDEITYTDYKESDETNEEDFKGYVYKIRYDENGNRLTFIKVLQGNIKVKDEITYGESDESKICEKVNSLRIYNGSKFTVTDKGECGELVALTGITNAIPGDMLGELKMRNQYEMVPTLVSKVIYDKSYNVKDVLRNFRILESEDPALNVTWSEELSEIHVHIMGKIQLEVLKEIVKERFNMDVEFGPCEILYKETITEPTFGYGHFEPLRHYAEVHLMIEPGKRNSGITFENKCHVDNLAPGYQNLVKTHIFEREHNGLITGSSLTDVRITLLNGRAHLKHTCGGDFREATFRALRQGLEKANNILLEPYYKFEINVTEEHIGRVLSDIQKLSGTFETPENENGSVKIKGRGPVSTFMDYSMEVIAFTKGKGSISFIYDGYDLCHNTEEVIEKRNYNKDSDIMYTSNSVFCSHGKGYIVKWQDADEAMHAEKIL
ncbi:TetM/TetW/TetO/TetS family tetracycline resistance ribosomal protection protein [Clostridium sp. SM-530-WT-3G]|uniref:GTP-binding protein n=1 Tax=Clostridium sp. SM-530-WT-3G TaxID=2725303 RepID=UPI00145CA55E|nr:TetM/TetW/TetO/TetS family tetracycline resistance ribosomal protection protein [Clostridium sp. SM-530-WT-3G]NME83387.1 TetM/TetW/TetO/TetS family tetracycline resistance ribosomal protection protein [Clostridium sp. SM-530-WT-3G]